MKVICENLKDYKSRKIAWDVLEKYHEGDEKNEADQNLITKKEI